MLKTPKTENKHEMLTCTMSKHQLYMPYMQAKCKESEVNALGMQTLRTYLTWTLNAIQT